MKQNFLEFSINVTSIRMLIFMADSVDNENSISDEYDNASSYLYKKHIFTKAKTVAVIKFYTH